MTDDGFSPTGLALAIAASVAVCAWWMLTEPGAIFRLRALGYVALMCVVVALTWMGERVAGLAAALDGDDFEISG